MSSSRTLETGAKAVNTKSNKETHEEVGARHDGDWGPCDIVKKALEILKVHPGLFILIQATIVLPCIILWLLNQHYIKILIQTFMPVPPGPPCEDPCSSPPPSDGPSPDEWKCVVAFLVLLFLGFVFWVNVVGSLYYSVGSIYAGKTISFKDVVKQLPCLWNGLFITGLWGYVFFFIAAVTAFLVGSVLMTFSAVSFLPLPVSCFLTFTFTVVVFFYVGTTTQMANGVTLFEQRCGWPAFCQALKLLKCKWCIAFGLALIFIIPQVILTAIANAVTWTWAGNCGKWMFFAILAYLLALVLEVNVISSALFYLFSNQSKQQTILVEHFTFSQFEWGYQLLARPEQVV